jgi:lysophospholipase L1-like esterase
MPLGDSLTKGEGSSLIPDRQAGYRLPLWDRLTGAGYHVTFVGSQISGPASLAEQRHEGHIGQTIDRLDAHVADLLAQAQPDVVLLMIGTTDLKQGIDVARAVTRLGRVVDRIIAAAPAEVVLVATLPPPADPALAARVAAYNAAIPDVVAPRRQKGAQIQVVDVGSVVTLVDLADPIHPSSVGYTKIADAWFIALAGHLPPPSRSHPSSHLPTRCSARLPYRHDAGPVTTHLPLMARQRREPSRLALSLTSAGGEDRLGRPRRPATGWCCFARIA